MRRHLTEETHRAVIRALNVLLVLCAIAALAQFVLIIGWPLSAATQRFMHVATRAVLGLFVLQEITRIVIHPHPLAHIRRRKLETALALVILCELALGGIARAQIGEWLPEVQANNVALFVLACSQLTLLGLLALRGLRRVPLLAARNLTPGGALILSFATLITIGALLLKTPLATPGGISWTNAFFTATSATCVTGLTVLDTAADFTRHGQYIILGLAQLGGLGIMTLTYFFAHFLTGGVSFRNRIALQDLLSEENLDQIGTVLGIIVGFTFSFELAGAIGIYFSLGDAGAAGPEMLAHDRLFFAAFHSVMAFCNAGFSTLPDGLANAALHGRPTMLAFMMALVIAGGIGFPVVKNFWQFADAVVRRLFGLRVAAPPRLTINSRIVLVTTAALVVGGAVAIWLTEFVFADGERAGLPALYTSLFHSITTRSCGFNISDTASLAPATMAVMMFLMFVGGSPASTAGGVKTSTLAVAVLALRRVLHGRAEIEAFGRRISDDTANRALAVMLLAGMFLLIIVVALCALHPQLPPMEVAFEAISATSTTGLSRGIAPLLSDAGKLVMIVAMFVGRIGVLMTLFTFIPRRPQTGYRLPEGSIVIT